jgi:FkbM family methyltransferase
MILRQLYVYVLKTLQLVLLSRNMRFLIGFAVLALCRLGPQSIRDRVFWRIQKTEAELRVPGGITLAIDLYHLANLGGIFFGKAYESVEDFAPRPGWTIIDIGAHMGIFAVRAARMVGEDGKVVAVEPHPHNYAALLGNIRRNMLQNVTPLYLAVSDHEGEQRLLLSKGSGGHTLLPSEGTGSPELSNLQKLWSHSLLASGEKRARSIVVKTVTLDQLIGNCRKVDLIKIDVEGAELLVLSGAARTLRRSGVRVVIESHSHELATKVVGLLQPYCRLIRPVYAITGYVSWGHASPTVYAITR